MKTKPVVIIQLIILIILILTTITHFMAFRTINKSVLLLEEKINQQERFMMGLEQNQHFIAKILLEEKEHGNRP